MARRRSTTPAGPLASPLIESTDADPQWQEFVAQFPADPRLEAECLYSLPESLLEALNRRAPRLLPDEDVRFETALRNLGRSGFYRQRCFSSRLLDPEMSTSVAELRPRVRQTLERWQHQQQAGHHASRIMEETQNHLQQRSIERLQGYTGWLLISPEFQTELQQLWRTWNAAAGLVPDLPTPIRPTWRGGGYTDGRFDRHNDAINAAQRFCQRWSLAGFDTAELPQPLSPILLHSDPPPTNELLAAGVTLFLPWSLFSDRDLKLSEVLDYHQRRQDLSHLTPWLFETRGKNWGPERLARLLKLYIYGEQAIRQRYATRLQGQSGNIDQAFAEFFHGAALDAEGLVQRAESVRKIRTQLRQGRSQL